MTRRAPAGGSQAGGRGRSLQPGSCQAAAGFSLIEVVITIGIMMTLTIAVASMLRSGFEVKAGLAERSATVHKLGVAAQKIADDLQHAFFVSLKDANKNGIDRNMKTIFKLDKNGMNGDKLQLTTMTHKPIKAGAYESEFTLVQYELKDSKEAPGRKDLYRGETAVIPLDLKEEQPEQVLARGIKSLTFEYWKGDGWAKDYWDTGRGDTRNRLPKMVRVTIEAYVHDRDGTEGTSELDEATDKVSTVVYIEGAADYSELKEPDKNVKWGAL